MRLSRCDELFQLSGTDVLLLAFAVHGEQVYLISHNHIVYDAIALGRSPADGRVSHSRFVYRGADAAHDSAGTLAALQPPGELLSLVNSVVILFSRSSSRSRNLGRALTRVGIARVFPAQFAEYFPRRATFAGRCLLQADADVFHQFFFGRLVSDGSRAPVFYSAQLVAGGGLCAFHTITSPELEESSA